MKAPPWPAQQPGESTLDFYKRLIAWAGTKPASLPTAYASRAARLKLNYLIGHPCAKTQ